MTLISMGGTGITKQKMAGIIRDFARQWGGFWTQTDELNPFCLTAQASGCAKRSLAVQQAQRPVAVPACRAPALKSPDFVLAMTGKAIEGAQARPAWLSHR
ncbi:hypothetical protein [Pseudomonas protegens]|uniref:hypothetical protein n=1 Tax=Pseudomonas protegens TaxID=380021 RepID=UPI00200E13A4|nr:hypothetical protein [Pseudomonas protegens]